MMTNIRVLLAATVIGWTSIGAGAINREADLRVAVVDRADGRPLSAAIVRLIRNRAVIREGITGSDGTIRFEHLPTGDALVESERVGFVRKPESRHVSIGDEPAVTIRLLSSQGDAAYFQMTASSIEQEAVRLSPVARQLLYEREWERIKTLSKRVQVTMARELAGARAHLSLDPEFSRLSGYRQ